MRQNPLALVTPQNNAVQRLDLQEQPMDVLQQELVWQLCPLANMTVASRSCLVNGLVGSDCSPKRSDLNAAEL